MAKYAGWCDSCFCFRDMRRAVVAVGMFGWGCPAIQILIAIDVFTGENAIEQVKFEPADGKETITYELYIALGILDLLLVIFSIVLIYGNERTDEVKARKYILPWLCLVPFYVIFESAINIFYFYNTFNGLYKGPLGEYPHAVGFSIVPLVYWVVKDIILFICFIFLIVRYISLKPQSVKYVKQVDHGLHVIDYNDSAGPVQAPIIEAPRVTHSPVMLPPAPACTACSGGCSANRCGKCNLVQPTYGYAGGPTANISKSGWVTNHCSGGR